MINHNSLCLSRTELLRSLGAVHRRFSNRTPGLSSYHPDLGVHRLHLGPGKNAFVTHKN